ncbi:MAG: TonB-dependent siderophore receptor, partial [Candidatus Accumulibacter sp.]|nr:TonB-dependent siderophore receptor [Accumulibacter sp.]
MTRLAYFGALSLASCTALAQEQAREAELPVVTVTESAVSETTEGTGSYTTRSMSSATKLPLAIHETPQSVTVITRQRIEDQAMVTV